MNFSLENYSFELLNFTETVQNVELISTFITAVCDSWNVSDKYTWDNAGDLKVGSHDPIFSSNYSSVNFLRQQLDV